LHAQQLITFANQAGLAINNARLYEQAQSAAILRERQRMAQELHDSVNQDLFAASTYADLLPKAIDRKPELVAQYAQDISKLIRGAVDQMRMILIELHPDALTTTGLEALIQQLCDVFQRQSGLPLNLSSSNSKIVVEEKVQIAVYRIAQEALHNVDKHARASRVDVTLQLSHADFYLAIEDNGSGFDQDGITEVQFGISGMRERALSIDADLLISSQIGQGTKIELRKHKNAYKSTHSDYSGRRS
jgi:signal transduction histidine kinase